MCEDSGRGQELETKHTIKQVNLHGITWQAWAKNSVVHDLAISMIHGGLDNSTAIDCHGKK